MKDEEVRKGLRGHEERIFRLEKNSIPGLHIGYCSVCKHDTIIITVDVGISIYRYYPETRQCLVCGTKWECREETVCKVVKE